jgi:hypothetical protein
MFGSVALELLIGLVTIFLLLSTVCSAVVEAIASMLGWRGENLRKGIARLLGGDGGESDLMTKFESHALIRGLMRKDPAPDRPGTLQRIPARPRARYPSYIPAAVFGDAVLEILIPDRSPNPEFRLEIARARLGQDVTVLGAPGPVVEQVLKNHPRLTGDPARALGALLDRATDEHGAEGGEAVLRGFRARIEAWFESTMERASGWYKRRVQLTLAIVAAILVGFVNADAIEIGSFLVRNPTQREALARAAESYAATSEGTGVGEAEKIIQAIEEIEIPLGWSYFAKQRENSARDRGSEVWITKSFGLLITVFAVMVGAPFWFDLLQKLVNLRGSGAKPPTADEEAGSGGGAGKPTPTTGEPPPAWPAPKGERPGGGGAGEVSCTTVPPEYIDAICGRGAWASAPLAHDTGADEAPMYGAHLVLARLSMLAYRDPRSARALLESSGVTLVDSFDARGTQAILCRAGASAIVAYRGTEPSALEDLITDARIALRGGVGFEGKVHRGFAAALDAVREPIDKAIAETLEDRTITRLWFTGHSLGGALATLHALHAAGGPSAEVRLCTFGAPLVGDRALAASARARFAGRWSHTRYINSRDPVARVPSGVLGYEHAGDPVVITPDGRVLWHQNEALRTLAFIVSATTSPRSASREALEDHAIGRYIERLESLARATQESSNGGGP